MHTDFWVFRKNTAWRKRKGKKRERSQGNDFVSVRGSRKTEKRGAGKRGRCHKKKKKKGLEMAARVSGVKKGRRRRRQTKRWFDGGGWTLTQACRCRCHCRRSYSREGGNRGIGRANKTLQAAEPQGSILDTLVVGGGGEGWSLLKKKMKKRLSHKPGARNKK